MQLDDKILDQLKKAQDYIKAMKDAADGVAQSFTAVGDKFKNLANGIKGSGVSLESAFNADGTLRSLKLIAEAIEGVGKKSSSVARQVKSDADKAKEKAVALSQEAERALSRSYTSGVDSLKEQLRVLTSIQRRFTTQQIKGNTFIDEAQVKRVNAEVARLRGEISSTEKKIRSANATIEATGKNATLVKTLLSQAFSPFMMQRFLQQMISVRGEFELAQKSLAVIIGDTAKAQSMFNEITTIAVRSPFSVSDILKQTKQLAAYRIEADKLIDTTKMLGDIAAGTGVEMNRLILAYGQVRAAEFLKGTELRQFSEAGVNMLGGLADRFSEIYGRAVSVGEVMQMISKRMVKFSDVEAVLKAATSAGGTFYKMQEQQADTLRGKLTNLQDRIQIAFNEMGRSYDGFMKMVISGLESLISNWKVISATIMPLLTGKLVSGIASIVGNAVSNIGASAGKISGKIVAINRMLAATGSSLNFVQKTIKRISATIKSFGLANILGVVTTIGMVLFEIFSKANQFQKRINDIVRDTKTEVFGQVSRYNELLDIAANVTNKEKDRQKALDALKSEYGNLLDLQKVELDNIGELNNKRQEQIDLIRMQAAEEARVKAMNEAVTALQKRRENRNKDAYQTLTEKGSAFSRRFGDQFPGLTLIDKDDSLQAFSEVEDMLLRGTVSTAEEASREYLKKMLIMAGATEDEIQKVIENTSDGYLIGVTGAFNKAAQYAEKIGSTMQKSIDTSQAVSARPYLKEIKAIEDYKKQFEEKPEYATNPQQRELDYYEFLTKWRDGIIEKIDSGALGGILPHIRDAVLKEVDRTFRKEVDMGGATEQLFRDFGAAFNKKYQDGLIEPLGKGRLAKAEDASWADYAKQISDVVEEYKEYIEVLEKGEAVTEQAKSLIIQYGGFGADKDDAIAKLKFNVEKLQQALEFVGPPAPKNTTTEFGNTYNSDLKSFISSLRNAKKEMAKLNEEGDKLFIEKLRTQGKKVGISIPVNFVGSDAEIKALVDKYKEKLSKEDRLEIDLAINTENFDDTLNAYSRLAKDLWDRYDNSKKLEDWGLVPTEGSVREVMDELIQLENYLREKGEREGIESAVNAANEIRDRRIQILRSEQEEAAKIMYDANKKALDKVEQAYQTMMENLAKIETYTGAAEDKDKAKENQVKKSMREIADAQWDAFKSSEAYALSFGDLSGLSDDLLQSLKSTLQVWLQMGDALNPSEIQSIQKAIRKMDEEMGDGKAKTYFGSIAMGLREIGEARKILDDIPNKERAVADAESEYMAAVLEEREAMRAAATDDSAEAQERLANAMARTAIASSSLDMAVNDLSNAQAKANKKLVNSVKRMQEIDSAYSSVGSVITETIDLVRDFADAFGLTVSDEAQAAIEGFEQGFQLIGQAMTVATAAMSAYNLMTEITTESGKKLLETMAPFLGPLLVALAAVGAILAVIKAKDVRLQKQVENHKENVEKLEKAYEKLGKAMDKALDLTSARQSYAEMNANLARQRKELEEAIAANEKRKQNDDVRNETEELKEQLAALDDKVEETKENWLEMLGAPTDYQGVARDWASDWLSAFKETGSGLDALRDDFDELYDDLVVGQLWTKIMGPQIENLQKLVKDALADGDLTDAEAAAIRAFKNSLAMSSKQMEDLAKDLGITGGAFSGDTLQRGVETVTEQTASAVESIMNTMRYDVSDTNAKLARLEVGILGEGENTILSHLRSQTNYLSTLARIASAVYYPGGHPKGAGALKVIAEIA